MKAFKKLLAAGFALALPLTALAQTTAPAEPVKPAEAAPPAPAAAPAAPAKPVIKFKFTGDLNNRAMLFTDQNGIYRASETIASTTPPIPDAAVEEAWAEIKYRLGVEAATENNSVKGVYMMEIGAVRFGNAGTGVGRSVGGGYSGDGVNVETRFAYVDFGLPTASKNRVIVGLQPFLVNKFLWNETAMALQLQGQMGTVGYTAAWARGNEFLNTTAANKNLFADADNLLGRVDVTPTKDLKGGVFALWQHKRPRVNPAIPTGGTTASAAPSHLLKNFGEVDYDIYNFGLDGAFKFQNFFVNLDGIFQSGSTNSKTTSGTPAATASRNLDLASFFLHADVGVNLGAAKVTYTGWYASGDDDANDGDIDNFIATDVDTFDSVIFFEGGYTDDNYFTEAPYFLTAGAIFNKLGLEYKVTPKLTAGAAVMYVMTSEDLTIGTGATSDTSKNLGTEIDASLSYKINPSLELAVNAGYLIADDGMDAFEANKNGEADRDIFRTTARARYQF